MSDRHPVSRWKGTSLVWFVVLCLTVVVCGVVIALARCWHVAGQCWSAWRKAEG